MHLEARYALLNAAYENWPELQDRIGVVPASDCDPKHNARLVSLIAFEISDLLGAEPPPVVARKILGLFSGSSAAKYFSIEQSLLGHLNITPTDVFFDEAWAVFARQGARALLSSRSWFNFKSPERSLVPTALPNGIEKQGGEEGDRLREFLQSDGRGFSADDLLMLLALEGDREISLSPYLWGLNCRERVPWYLEQCQRDAAKFADLCQKKLSDGELEAGKQTFPEALQSLLVFRRAAWNAESDPSSFPQLLAASSSLANSFYRIYHHPRVRSFQGISSAEVERLHHYSSLVSSVIRVQLRNFYELCAKRPAGV